VGKLGQAELGALISGLFGHADSVASGNVQADQDTQVPQVEET